ncbi:MAG TPA: DNA repair protein RecN [Clostridia bacterium]
MLLTLRIKNIAIIKELELSFDSGLIVLSGETGAGKSIIVDSLNFLLGSKTDKTLLKSGEKEALVQGVFCVNPDIQEQLKSLGIPAEDDTVIISRTLNSEGRSECRVNGALVTLSMLRTITESMVDIHGQHEHQSLLRPKTHLKLLDAYIKDLEELKNEVSALYNQYKKLTYELSSFGISDAERERMLDLLKFQIDEITQANLKEGEERQLLDERAKIINFERIMRGLSQSYEFLGGSNGAANLVSEAVSALGSITAYDPAYQSLYDRLQSVQYELEDIVATLQDSAENLNYDEKTADKIENRLELIKNLKKKYGSTFEEIQEFLKNAQKEYNRLSTSAETIEKLKSEIQIAGEELYQKAALLSQKRRQGAEQFCKDVNNELKDLGMAGSKFEIQFDEIPSKDAFYDFITSEGFDKAEFYFSANAGEPPKPLAKIASGGEMSRIMLALKMILSKHDQIDTMIFDEIDAGISGKIGQAVANKLACVSRMRQVITITHLAAICAMADHNYLIYKQEEDGKTYTKVERLDYDKTIKEIARLAGGHETSSLSLEHAKELKRWSDEFKKSI